MLKKDQKDKKQHIKSDLLVIKKPSHCAMDSKVKTGTIQKQANNIDQGNKIIVKMKPKSVSNFSTVLEFRYIKYCLHGLIIHTHTHAHFSSNKI